MSAATRTFHLGDILSITTGGILVSPRYMDGIYDILGWMTGESLFTHQLVRAARECQGPLLAQHPDLAAIEVPDFGDGDPLDRELAITTWLAEMTAAYGETREVAPLAAGDHTRIDPLDELRMMRPDMEIIPVVLPDETTGGAA